MNKIFKTYYNYRYQIQKECNMFYEKINMVKNVLLYKNDLFTPYNNVKLNKINNNTCFDIMETDIYPSRFEPTVIKRNISYDVYKGTAIKAKEVILKLNGQQRYIIQKWLNAYRLMYNITLKYIKNNNKINLNWIKIRKTLLNQRDELVRNSGDFPIGVHEIDYAIKLACQNYKTCKKLLKLKIIKHFRLRYWKSNKEKKILDLEKTVFKSGSIRKKVLGDVKGYYNGKEINFKEITKDCRLIYKNNKYYLYVPEDVKIENKNKENKIISLDPGIRTFLTGISNNKAVEIKNITNLDKYIKIKEKNKKKNIPAQIKSKIEKRCNKKLTNIINELHWKTINYLTTNYSKVLIGNMSTKSIISNKNNLSSVTKKKALLYRLYEFRQRLQYKCYIRGVNYKCTDEKYTSKMCKDPIVWGLNPSG